MRPIRTMGRRLGVAVWLAGLMVLPGGALSVVAAADASPATEPSPAAQPASPQPGSSPDPGATDSGGAEPADVAIRTELLIDGLATPVYLADDGISERPCLYIVERGGTVQILQDGELKPRPFLDISNIVQEGAEQGLHSIAFHPDFASNGRVFLHFNDKQGRTRVSEFRGRPCRPGGRGFSKQRRDLISEVRDFPNNSAGWIGFGRDGYLYVPLGDGGGVSPGDPKGVGQARSPRLSKVLRMDVDQGRRYGIPRDNPFAKRRQGYPPETWAMGLRDPRRSSFDRATGDLWIGDLGQDRFEEVNRIPEGEGGLNFGWSDMEGDQCHNLPDCDPTAYTLPVHFYDQVSPHCGIVGGYVYRGEAIPALEGTYLSSDLCSGYIWGLDAEAVADDEPPSVEVLLDAPQVFVSFGEDDAGELYLVSLDGSIYRIAAEVSG